MRKEKMLNLINKVSYYLNKYAYLLLPIITGIIFLLICKGNELYPFGNKTIAWCDMNQQGIPLLSQFKDVLEGKKGFTYNFANAGGMSLFSVYFFFLSSPFSYLVVFVEKAEIANFMNLIVMFKLMVASLTMGIYIKKKYENLNVLFLVSFSLLYTYSVYNLMYYQNIMWLDIVYLFPLLVLSLDHLLDKNKFLPYLVLITLIVITNYYIAFMVICFVLIYVGLNLYQRRQDKDIQYKARNFIISSLIAALISCFSIIPSFIQYLESARGESLINSLSFSWFLTHLQTTLPLLLGSTCVIPFLFKKDVSNERKIKYIILLLLLIPIIIDPINCMWHLGSYQAFPCRFAFMLVFLTLDIVAINLKETQEEKFDFKHILGFSISLILIISLYVFEKDYINKKIIDLDQYSHSLWGNSTSLEALLRYYSIILIAVLIIYLLFKLKFINKKVLSITFINLTIIEILFSTSVYLIPPSNDSSSYQKLYSLSEHIDDDSFYRVKTETKITDVNNVGAVGFNSLSHYTSLTSEDYMFTMKKLGYSSYWMEVGSHGGTSFTDALLVNKYTLKYGSSSSSICSNDYYHLEENKVFPFGIITDTNLEEHTELKEDTRVNMQETLYQALFNSNNSLHTIYDPSELSNIEILKDNSRTTYKTSGNGSLTYSLFIKGTQSVYFEAFDKYSNNLTEAINEKITITCGSKYYSSYPNKNLNGTICLGTFTNQKITVRVKIKETIAVSSLNVFSVNEEILDNEINNVINPNLEVKPNKIEGTFSSNNESYLFLPISYTKGINAKINGKKVDVIKVFSSFVAIKLVEGENNLTISYSQPGFGIGLTLSFIGIAMLVLYLIFKDKINWNKIIDKFSYILSIIISSLTLFILYIFPLIINIIYQIR